MSDRVVVVGASLAGVRFVKGLRRRGFDGELVLVGEDPELAYDRPPLSKKFLTGDDPVEPKWLEPAAFYDGLDLRLGVRATALRAGERTVVLDDGSTVRGDHVVVATGSVARVLPGLPDGERVTRLRTLADARRIRAAFGEVEHVLVVGGGFIGCEVAASGRRRGLQVTIVEPAAAPVIRGVGSLVGGTIAALHRDRGVDVRLGVAVASVEDLGDRSVVTLTDGSTVETGLIVVGVGADPNTGWLADSGLDVDRGVACDDRGRAEGGGGHVWALGDAAAWTLPGVGARRRLEHWTSAVEQAGVVAANLLGAEDAPAHDAVPYVWSDQYEHKFQILGEVSGDHRVTVLRGSVDERRFALAYSRDDRLCGLVTLDMPREIAMLRPKVEAGVPLADVV